MIPLSYFTEELQIVKLDGRDEALTGAPYARVSDNYIVTGMSGNTPFKHLIDKVTIWRMSGILDRDQVNINQYTIC